MANKCITQIIFKGKKENVLMFHKLLEKAIKKAIKKAKGEEYVLKKKNGDEAYYDPMWLGLLFIELGYEYSKITKRGLTASFVISNQIISSKSTDEVYCKLTLEDKWKPQKNILKKIKKEFSLDYVLLAKEPGLELYINTDKKRKYFKANYNLNKNMFEDFKKNNNSKRIPNFVEEINKEIEEEDMENLNKIKKIALKHNIINRKDFNKTEICYKKIKQVLIKYQIELCKYKSKF